MVYHLSNSLAKSFKPHKRKNVDVSLRKDACDANVYVTPYNSNDISDLNRMFREQRLIHLILHNVFYVCSFMLSVEQGLISCQDI